MKNASLNLNMTSVLRYHVYISRYDARNIINFSLRAISLRSCNNAQQYFHYLIKYLFGIETTSYSVITTSYSVIISTFAIDEGKSRDIIRSDNNNNNG